MGPEINLKMNKRWKLELDNQLRLQDKLSGYDSYIVELGSKYEVNDFMAAKIKLRYVDRPGNYDSEEKPEHNRYRISNDINWRLFKKKNWKLYFRNRYTYTTENFTKKHYNYLRNKVNLEYTFSKIATPYLSAEVYFRFDDKNQFKKIRITSGIVSSISKTVSLTVFFRNQREINVHYPDNEYIIGCMLSYNLKRKDFTDNEWEAPGSDF